MAFTSCKKDETLRYNNITMGNIDGECIVSDQGNTFEITEGLTNLDMSKFEYGRVILACDVLKKTGENTYSIRLNDIASVLAKDPVNESEIKPEDDINVDDPLYIKNIWYGGGYINMLLEFAVKEGSDTKHLINLVYNGATDTEEGLKNYTFTLRHNAFGDVASEETADQYRISGGYVSFPVAEMIEGDEAAITLNWHSYARENGWYSIYSSEAKNKTFDWIRIGYEHPQKNSIVAPSAVCLR